MPFTSQLSSTQCANDPGSDIPTTPFSSRETARMKPIAAPIVGGMITSLIHVLILVPVFFALMKESALRRGTLQPKESHAQG